MGIALHYWLLFSSTNEDSQQDVWRFRIGARDPTFSRSAMKDELTDLRDLTEYPPAKGEVRFLSAQDWFIELERHLRLRSISAGIELLDQIEPHWPLQGRSRHVAPEFLLSIAQWIDVGYREPAILRSMLDTLTMEDRLELRVGDYLRVQLAEAFYALTSGQVDSCILSLENILRLDSELLNSELATLAHLWKARAHRKKADYVNAAEHINAAHELATKVPESSAVTAIIQVQQAWVLFQCGDPIRALQVLNSAEAVLKRTDHWIAMGNIESARGRIVRRKGDYEQSLEHFKRAVAFYERRNLHHPNLARTAMNLAFVKRLMALQLRRHIDHTAVARRTLGAEKHPKGQLQPLHRQYGELYQSAIAELERAKHIYMLQKHSGGVATALLNAGYLHLDGGNIELATREASEALLIADRTNNIVLRTRAHILSAWIENARFEGQMGNAEELPNYARRAKLHCVEALGFAESTQNKRLLLNAHVALGEVAANDFFHDYEFARRCVDAASSLLGAEDADYTLDELNALKSKLMEKVGIDDRVRAWSHGLVDGKTLEEVTENFAEVVVTQLWLREDRKVARVARILCTSPKRVRKLIRHQQR